MARSKEEKEAIVQSFLSQSISKTSFCKENNVSQPTLNRLLKQFDTSAGAPEPEVQFMKVSLPTESNSSRVDTGIRLELNDMTLYLPSTTSATFIGELLKVVTSIHV